MDQSAFYGVMSGINFTLLGLWWVAVKDRADLVAHDDATRRMAYLVSLQFVVPATVSLLAQVSPDIPEIWRFSFVVAGFVGAVGVAMLARELGKSTDAKALPLVFAAAGIPIYALVAVVALAPHLVIDLGLLLKPIEVEALLLSIIAFLGVQEAWFVAMTPAAKSKR